MQTSRQKISLSLSPCLLLNPQLPAPAPSLPIFICMIVEVTLSPKLNYILSIHYVLHKKNKIYKQMISVTDTHIYHKQTQVFCCASLIITQLMVHEQ